MLVLDSGAFSFLAQRSTRSRSLIEALRAAGMWPPVVPTVVLVECLQGHPGRDAPANRLLKTVRVGDEIPVSLARRAGELRRVAGRGSAVDALVVASAEPGGLVLTGDAADIVALASHADGVGVETI